MRASMSGSHDVNFALRYSYPSQIPDAGGAAASYVAATESDATLLSTNAVSAWESAGACPAR